jgi:FkbM family methyltransferase
MMVSIMYRYVFTLLICAPRSIAILQGEKEVQLTNALRNKHHDFKPRFILDIGANVGAWTNGVHQIYPYAQILMLEATPNKDEVLKKVKESLGGQVEYNIAILSEKKDETVKFYQGGDTGNSMFKENTKFYDNDVGVDRITSTVDDEIQKSSFDIKDLDYIKIDVQGAELTVLKGAEQALSQATFVQFEAGTIEYNQGGACFFEIDEFLRQHGFFFYDFGEIAYARHLFKTLGAGQFDVLYVKPSSPILPKAMKSTKFCGLGRATLPLQNFQGDYTISNYADSTIAALETKLEIALSKHKSSGFYFLAGYMACIFTIIAVFVLVLFFKKILFKKKHTLKLYHKR